MRTQRGGRPARFNRRELIGGWGHEWRDALHHRQRRTSRYPELEQRRRQEPVVLRFWTARRLPDLLRRPERDRRRLLGGQSQSVRFEDVQCGAARTTTSTDHSSPPSPAAIHRTPPSSGILRSRSACAVRSLPLDDMMADARVRQGRELAGRAAGELPVRRLRPGGCR